jgi:hypothetical protein
MARKLCLTRDYTGLCTRIECEVRPLAGNRGLWTLLCAAGMSAAQPSVIKAQGPFHGPLAAESVLAEIAQSLLQHGYRPSPGEAIWCLHLQAELRRLNADCRCGSVEQVFHPEG